MINYTQIIEYIYNLIDLITKTWFLNTQVLNKRNINSKSLRSATITLWLRFYSNTKYFKHYY